jgi:hypothetical protein
LDWFDVYESGWYPYWLNASINIKDMFLNSFWPIQSLSLKWSKYDLLTDKEKILDLVKNGNYYYNSFADDKNTKTEDIQVEIWDAQLVYLKQYTFSKENNSNDEYFVPGLMFKVFTESDYEKMIFPWEYVTVPLVWSFIDNDINVIPLESI